MWNPLMMGGGADWLRMRPGPNGDLRDHTYNYAGTNSVQVRVKNPFKALTEHFLGAVSRHALNSGFSPEETAVMAATGMPLGPSSFNMPGMGLGVCSGFYGYNPAMYGLWW